MFPASRGNRKIGRDTLIINITSATDCPSRRLGMCPLDNPDRCYALKAERLYPQCLPYRRRQTKLWDKLKPKEIAQSLIERIEHSKKPKIKYVRFSESGDFRCQADVDKMSEIASLLKPYKITVYGYTARKDLDFSKVSSNMVVTGSRFMVHNEFVPGGDVSEGYVCALNCRVCDLCKSRRYVVINCKMH